MKQPIGITYEARAGQSPVGVYEADGGAEVLVTDVPYLAGDGLQDPLPVFDAGGPIYADALGNVQASLAILGGTLPPEQRVSLDGSEDIAFSGHSFPYQAVAPDYGGKLGNYWTGAIHFNFMEFSSLKQRWDVNGVDRTEDYGGALIVTEIGDLETGLADPARAQGIETLQYLYWFALTAQAKGAKLFGIYPPHSPEGVNVDADAMAKVQYWIDWLRARPEVTIPVYAIPVPIMVRAMIDRYAPVSIYADGLHLNTDVGPPPVNQMNNALGQMVRMFLIGERPADDPEWGSELIALTDMAWGILSDHEITGLGGATVVEPYPVAADPLPEPEPLP